MKTVLITLLLAATALSLKAAPEPIVTAAVFEFEAREEPLRELGPKISALIAAQLSAQTNMVMVERAELDKALGEQEFALSGTVSPETAARVGQLIGAKVLVTGRAYIVDGKRYIIAKVIGAETSRVFAEASSAALSAPLNEQVTELANKIHRIISGKRDALMATVKSRADRVAQLKQRITTTKPLPTVRVRIPEQHFGAAVRDPAAQTELLLVLQECGFSIADAASPAADLEITGEAFSAFATRKGNLVSCKARVEVAAHETSSRKLLAADRQTSVAVDLAEQTAAKTALQEAALDIAERLLPKLVQR